MVTCPDTSIHQLVLSVQRFLGLVWVGQVKIKPEVDIWGGSSSVYWDLVWEPEGCRFKSHLDHYIEIVSWWLERCWFTS